MTKDELLVLLRELATWGDKERAHAYADLALLRYLGDDDITAAYDSIIKWYA